MPLFHTLQFILSHPFNRDRKLGALWNVLKWQLKARLSNKFFVHPFVNSTQIYAKKGLTGVTGNIYCGLHEWQEMGFALHFLRPTDTFVDIGANVGTYTLLGAGVVGSDTIAFEPSVDAAEILQKNLDLNQLTHVQVYRVGLSDRSDILRFSYGEDTKNHVLPPGAERGVEIEGRRLDDCINTIPALIKIDVEGYELQVLKGAVKTISDANQHALIMEWNVQEGRFGYSANEILGLLRTHGYSPVQYDPYSRSLKQIDPHDIGANGIFIKNHAICVERVRSAPKMRIQGKMI